jgi:hypothetical protein
MYDFFFDIPLVWTGVIIIGFLFLFVVAGLFFVRHQVLPRFRIHFKDSEFSGSMMQSVMVFYGLAVALMAVNVSESYNDVSKIISTEASTLAALYRDVSSYPEPIRPQLQNQLREYTHYTIHDAWPLQAKGLVPSGGVQMIDHFQVILTSFEPSTEGQKIVHAETLRAYNTMIQARRLRLDAVGTGLPGIMWSVIVAGALIGLTTSFFFKVEDPRLHLILVLLLALFVGLVIFMVVALDQPFRGDLGLSPEPYQLIYDQLMNVKK